MSKDPAFLFYPGDYLRDTQTLSEKTQVAYDRIICEHMRNICISQSQLKFFTKRLTEDEIEELMFVLTKKNGGYQVEWVAESIRKRKAYSESRRKNRKRKNKKHMNIMSDSYVSHMENENENENVIDNKKVIHIEDAYDFLKENEKSKIEVFEMQNKKSFPNFEIFKENFNSKVIEESLSWEPEILLARLYRLNINWDKTPKQTGNKKTPMQILRERDAQNNRS